MTTTGSTRTSVEASTWSNARIRPAALHFHAWHLAHAAVHDLPKPRIWPYRWRVLDVRFVMQLRA